MYIHLHMYISIYMYTIIYIYVYIILYVYWIVIADLDPQELGCNAALGWGVDHLEKSDCRITSGNLMYGKWSMYRWFIPNMAMFHSCLKQITRGYLALLKRHQAEKLERSTSKRGKHNKKMKTKAARNGISPGHQWTSYILIIFDHDH